MKFRAVAVASQRSNAVGTVEVECTPSGLVIVYLGVGAFSQGYATAAVTSGTRVMAPWSAVLEARAEGEQIFLGLDHAVSPHNRLTLVNFSTGEGTHHLEARRQRAMVRVAFVALALIAALAAMFTLPRLSARVGAATALGVGAVAAFSILTIGFIADRRIPFGGFYTETARLGFVSELGSYLPNLIRAPLPPKPGRAPWLPAFQGFLPRTTLAIVITLSASILGAVLVAHSILENKPEPGSPERETSRSDKGRGETESRDFAAQPAPMPLVPAPPAPLATSVSPALTESAPASSAPPKAQPPRTEPVLARLLGPCT
ncbi:MAG TPA: hypothetical protein VGJ84_02210, partial [Polyangiaceae bacterium]